jgi:hypothetical protein
MTERKPAYDTLEITPADTSFQNYRVHKISDGQRIGMAQTKNIRGIYDFAGQHPDISILASSCEDEFHLALSAEKTRREDKRKIYASGN